jgi:hypothetical protein
MLTATLLLLAYLAGWRYGDRLAVRVGDWFHRTIWGPLGLGGLALVAALPLAAQAARDSVVCTQCVKADSAFRVDTIPVVRYDTSWTYVLRDSVIRVPVTPPPPPPPAAGSGLPVGFTLAARNTFDAAILAPGWAGQSGYASQYRIANDPAISRDGSPYLELPIPAGHRGGTGFQDLTVPLPAGCREVAYSVWFRSTPTPPYNSNVQKLIHWWGPSGDGGQIKNVGLTNLYITAKGYTVYAAFQRVETTNLGAGSTNKTAKGISNQAAGGGFPFDTWVRLEGVLRMNDIDSPTGANGYHRITRTAPSGVARVNAENVFWTADVPVTSRTWRYLTIDPTTPGAIDVTAGNPVPYTLYFDDFVVGCR